MIISREQPPGSNEYCVKSTGCRTVIFCFIYEDPNLAEFCALGYIAGFTDSEVSSRSDLYDVYVNLADSEITGLFLPYWRVGFIL